MDLGACRVAVKARILARKALLVCLKGDRKECGGPTCPRKRSGDLLIRWRLQMRFTVKGEWQEENGSVATAELGKTFRSPPEFGIPFVTPDDPQFAELASRISLDPFGNKLERPPPEAVIALNQSTKAVLAMSQNSGVWHRFLAGIHASVHIIG
jgi:hypothetical protein